VVDDLLSRLSIPVRLPIDLRDRFCSGFQIRLGGVRTQNGTYRESKLTAKLPKTDYALGTEVSALTTVSYLGFGSFECDKF
jgi:hypothetical protein